MNSRPIGFSTGCFHHHSILNILGPIRENGFREIEISSWRPHLDYHNETAVRRAAAVMESLDLRAISYHAPFGDHIDITSPDPALRESAIQELLTACRAGAALGASQIVLHPGPDRAGRPPEPEFQERLKLAIDSIHRLADLCRPLELTLLLENMLPHLLFGNPDTLFQLLEKTADAGTGACLDSGHAHLAHALNRLVKILNGRPGILHLHDNHGDRDAHLTPGAGGIDWLHFLTEVSATTFHGHYMLELAPFPHESPAETLTRAAAARRFLQETAPV